MATHVAKGASAVIPPSAPVERHQVFYIIPVGSGSQPQVPVQFFGYRSRLGRPGNALRPYRAVRPAMHGVHIANNVRFKPFLHQTYTVVRSALVSHLRSEEHTSELQSLMRTSYAVFCLKKKKH